MRYELHHFKAYVAGYSPYLHSEFLESKVEEDFRDRNDIIRSSPLGICFPLGFLAFLVFLSTF
ncbi:MAG: hypothetical protein AB7F86_15440 [Bdellovibrionales bacterium]